MKLRTTRVIVSDETIGLSRSFGETIGTLIDQRIASALVNNETLQTINVEFTPEEWNELADNAETSARFDPSIPRHDRPQLKRKPSLPA